VKDLRDWIATLESHDLLHRVVKEVDVRDCSEIIAENYKQATLFEDVLGYNSQLVANAISSRKMMALALDTEETNILSEYASRIAKPTPPKFASTSKGARCQEEILAAKESDVDLTTLPILLQHEFDGAPYISAGTVVAKDPETGEYNIGIYRLMFRKINELGINITAPHRLRWFYQKAYEKGKPLEVAVCLGLHALDHLAAVTTSPEGVDELAVWGGLQKEAIPLVHCKTVDLYVPEHAEIVLEGRMDPIGWVEPEGMYGEFPGTYSGMRKNPVVTIQAITSRKKAIYQSATHGGRHLAYTDFFVLIPQIELSIHAALRNAGIDVKQVRIVAESAGMMCYASINVRAKGDSRNAVYVILSSSRQNFPKYCVLVDADIDVFDDEVVMWALSTRSQPKDDTVILKEMRIPSSSDPSLVGPAPYSMSKMGIDATISLDADKSRFKHSRPPQVVSRRSSKGNNLTKLVENIRKLLQEKGPLFFYELTKEFPEESFRNILLGWNELSVHREIEEGMDGKHSILKNGEIR